MATWRFFRIGVRVFAGLMLLVPATFLLAQQVTQNAAGGGESVTFGLSEVFTFLFITLGPLKLIGPFAVMTRGREEAFKKRLALRSTIIAAVAVGFAPTIGASILRKWGVSAGSLLMTAGIVLFMVALKTVLEQFEPREKDVAPAEMGPEPSAMSLAFPTIVTPYGTAVLIVLVTLRSSDTTIAHVLGVAVFILLLDWLAMLFAERILKRPFLAVLLRIVGAVMAVLQVALGVEMIKDAVRLLIKG